MTVLDKFLGRGIFLQVKGRCIRHVLPFIAVTTLICLLMMTIVDGWSELSYVSMLGCRERCVSTAYSGEQG